MPQAAYDGEGFFPSQPPYGVSSPQGEPFDIFTQCCWEHKMTSFSKKGCAFFKNVLSCRQYNVKGREPYA